MEKAIINALRTPAGQAALDELIDERLARLPPEEHARIKGQRM
jgi:hypothetical protein